jgi:alpha-tubulin suppressor-like RCC1 family protein
MFQVVPSLQGEVVAVAAGGSHSLFVTADHTLWACGRTSLGRLGLPEAVLAAPDLPGAKSAGAAAKAEAAKVVDDDNRGLGTPHRLVSARPPLQPTVVSAGGQHSCVVFNRAPL